MKKFTILVVSYSYSLIVTEAQAKQLDEALNCMGAPANAGKWMRVNLGEADLISLRPECVAGWSIRDLDEPPEVQKLQMEVLKNANQMLKDQQGGDDWKSQED